jgi:4TM region of DNA translocase FtsK/SpoIIIE
MSRKTSEPHQGWNDVIGVALLALALLLFVSQLTFDRYDISFLTTHVNSPMHNWIKLPGAYIAYASFLLLGITAYILPWLLALFGVSYFLRFFSYLRERFWWSFTWSFVLLLSITGLLCIADDSGKRGTFHSIIGAPSLGGLLGLFTYGQTQKYNIGFSMLGPLGAFIVYAALCLISLLFLTNFRLGDWIRALIPEQKVSLEEPTPQEAVLARRARDLEKQAKQLQEQVARSGLGADMQPVPEPTVRDLSVPQAKGPRIRKTTLPEKAR